MSLSLSTDWLAGDFSLVGEGGVSQLEIERQALSKEKDKSSKERLAHLESDLTELKGRSSVLRVHWEQEKT